MSDSEDRAYEIVLNRLIEDGEICPECGLGNEKPYSGEVTECKDCADDTPSDHCTGAGC